MEKCGEKFPATKWPVACELPADHVYSVEPSETDHLAHGETKARDRLVFWKLTWAREET